MKKKIISMVLVLCMAVGLLPTMSITAEAASYTTGLFAAKFSQNQIFDIVTSTGTLNGLPFDSSWGMAFNSSGHQFTDGHLSNRYFVFKYTGDDTYPVGLFLYNNDGTPVVSDGAGGYALYDDSLIGLNTNECLTPTGQSYMDATYGGINGLVAQGTVTKLDDNGFLFVSKNGFGYYIAGNRAYSGDENITWVDPDTSVTTDELDDIITYSNVPLYAVTYNANTMDSVINLPDTQTKTSGTALTLSNSTPARAGYTFDGWNTQASGGGNPFAKGSDYNTNAPLDLYAVWKDILTASALATFDSQTVGYASAPAAQTVTITNTGDQAITLTEPAITNASSNYNIGALSTTNLAVSGMVTFTVQPKTGLAVGSYSETLNIEGTNSAATSTSAQFTVNAASHHHSNHNASTPSEDNEGASVIVNDETYVAGKSINSNEDGKTVTKLIVDAEKIETILETQGEHASVIIPVTTGSDVVSSVLTGQIIKKMEEQQATITIKTTSATYTLPASEINIDAVSGQLGTSVALSDIVVDIQIAEPSDQTLTIVESAARSGAFSIVAPAVEFIINCTDSNKTVSVSSFNDYVERTIAIPNGVDAAKITTGVIVNSDGTVRHVPTKVTIINGKYYAVINSLSNSTYTVIWNPIEFIDVTDHWAKDAINDMGSRKVVTGVGDNNYDADRNITRAEFATIVCRALGLAPETKKSGFDDVEDSDWYCGYIETAVSYGIITGYSKTAFGPNDEITREQAMTMIARAMKITGLDAVYSENEMAMLLESYTDLSNASEYAQSSIAACLKTGVATGRTSTLVAPTEKITRAEVAVIIQRLLKNSKLI